uniref:Uncharacterized protein n=1 Tax=Rhizophora mucronata TaxID=61149 RepID=A0A2P2J0A1_RHIMU
MYVKYNSLQKIYK